MVWIETWPRTLSPTFSVMPSPQTRLALFTTKQPAEAIPASFSQMSTTALTQSGIGTVRMWPTFPIGSTMAQCCSRCCRWELSHRRAMPPEGHGPQSELVARIAARPGGNLQGRRSRLHPWNLFTATDPASKKAITETGRFVTIFRKGSGRIVEGRPGDRQRRSRGDEQIAGLRSRFAVIVNIIGFDRQKRQRRGHC